MPLPDLIEIIPLDEPVPAEITVPGSKSITNRALILAALADGEVTLTGALWSEDTQVMTEALQTLGFMVRVENDPAEFCNRAITVQGLGGNIPKAGTAEKPLELFVGNAGTAARFLAAMVCLGDGVYRLSGVPRMHERPQAALFQALRELGYRVDATNDKLPATIFGSSQRESAQTEGGEISQSGLTSAATNKGRRSCTVSINESSQFASALLLSAKHGGWDVKVAGDDDEEAPYVTMTEKLSEVFPWGGGKFQIEPDASSGSYFWAAGILESIPNFKPAQQGEIGCRLSVSVLNWPESGWQIDQNFPVTMFSLAARSPVYGAPFLDDVTTAMGAISRSCSSANAEPPLCEPLEISRRADLGDSIMTSVVLAPHAYCISTFADLGRLRVQECERVVALRTELTKCGAKVVEEGDTLTVYPAKPGELHGAEIETYNDHRMAMCFAILGLKVPGIRLKNPTCVKKTFPNFFQKLAAPPPNGLGVEIWEVKDGKRTRKLAGEDLFAD
jgi:3-phosphoshikimate 1-carboxyvinyltransferase